MSDYILTFDGGSRGNPGVGYGSYVLVGTEDGERSVKRLRFGTTTNNQAEYMALIAGLSGLAETIREAGGKTQVTSVEIRGDSQLVINQVARDWKVKSLDLMELRDQVDDLLSQFGSFRLSWHRRGKSEDTLGH
ncbi:MAG: ribonuclease HI family protein [Anaerolineae bacterium]